MKRCKKCLYEYSGWICPRCGDIADREKRLKYAAVTVAVVIIFGFIMVLMKYYSF